MKSIISNNISGIENLSNEGILNALFSTPEHSIDCINWSEYPYAPKVSFHIAHSERALVVMFKVVEDHVRAVTLESNGPVWEDSCVELFVGNPKEEGYFNFEMNCVGTMLAAKRKYKTDANHFGTELMSQIRNFGSLEHKAIDSKGENQSWWRVEIIPFSLLGLDSAPERLKANLYKCGDKCAQPHFLSWSEIGLPTPNFHCPDYFGEIILSK